jgi:hypothetical protein
MKSGSRYCVVKDDGDVKKCYRTRQEAERFLRALYANVKDARADDLRQDDDEREIVNRVYDAYHNAVNMTASELQRWAETECSKLASLTRAPIKRNLHLLQTPKEQWGLKEVRWARKTISFIARMKQVEQGEPVREGCPSARDIALMNWAYRPVRSGEQRADHRYIASAPPSCNTVNLSDVDDPRKIWVLAMPFNIVDSYRTYFSQRTDRRLDLVPENVPVFDHHGLKGSERDTQPIGRTLEWRKDDAGWWALVQLTDDSRAEKFASAAAECKLYASVGMMRAGMYPQPPAEGVFDEPTELLQAPVVELSLIDTRDGGAPANYAAVAAFDFRSSCLSCQEKESTKGESPMDDQALNDLRAQLEALRAENEALKQKVEEEKKMRMRDAMAQRMMKMQVPQSVINELLDIFGDMPEGDQEKVMDVVGRLVSTIRAERGDQRASASELRSMLTQQFYQPNFSANGVSHANAPDDITQRDKEWVRRRMEQVK